MKPIRLASIRCDRHPESLAVRYVRATQQHLCAECAAEQNPRRVNADHHREAEVHS